MKKTSKISRRAKINAILASLIFGSLVLTGCHDMFNNNGGGIVTDDWSMKSEDIQKIYDNINDIIDKDNRFAQLKVLKNGDIEHLSEVLPERKFYVHPTIVFENSIEYNNTGYIDLVKYLTEKDNPNNQKTTPELKKENLSDSEQEEYQNAKDKVDAAIAIISKANNEDILKETSEDVTNHSKKAEEKISEIKNLIETELKKRYPEIKVDSTPTGIDFSKLYLRMSDLDSSKLPAVSAQTPDAEIIPGVKRILRNGRTAIDFTESNAEIKIDFEGKNTDVSNFYRGGIIYNNNNNISLLRDNAKFAYTKINKQDFNNKGTDLSLLDVDSVNFSELIFSVSDNNIYGAGINNIITKYLTNNQEDKITIMTGIDNTTAIKYDAKEVVDETQSKRMFDDNNNLNPALDSNTDITIDADFASFLLSKDVSVKNVIIDNTEAWPDSRKSQLGGTLVNSVVETSMEEVDGLKVKGLVRFEQKSPKTLSGNQYSKVIFKDENTWNDELVTPGKSTSGYPFLDISSLSNKQDDIGVKLGYAYLSEDKVNTVVNFSAASYLFGEKYYRRNNYDYDNVSREEYGNKGTIPTTVRNRTKVEDGATVPLSRANNIKLTPMQKLLLDDQHIYG